MALRETDILTGLYTPGYLIAFGARELAYAHEHGYPVSLITINIPNYTTLLASPDAGSSPAMKLINVIKRTAGRNSVIARTGQTEISILLPETDSVIAAGIAYKIKRLLTSKITKIMPGEVLSIGIASASGKTAEINELVRRAHEAMETSRDTGILKITG